MMRGAWLLAQLCSLTPTCACTLGAMPYRISEDCNVPASTARNCSGASPSWAEASDPLLDCSDSQWPSAPRQSDTPLFAAWSGDWERRRLAALYESLAAVCPAATNGTSKS